MPESIDALQERARGGDAGAVAELGRRVLSGDGVRQDKAEGVRMLEEAASRGSGDAEATLGVLSAMGFERPRDLGAALDFVVRAAELGWPPSQRELRFLAGGEGNDWAALRGMIDPSRWLKSPDVRVISTEARIGVVEGFATAAECEWLIALGRDHLKPAAGGPTQRTCAETTFNVRIADVVLELIRERMAAALGIGANYFQLAKLFHYARGEQFPPHVDVLDPDTPDGAEKIRERGQRVATFLLYLNDDYEGGETEFLPLGIRHKGKRGDGLLFTNVSSCGVPDVNMLHAGRPVTRGEKWLLSQWVRNKSRY